VTRGHRFIPLLAAMLLAAPAARASITPRAQKVVDRYVEVTGGAEALAKQGRVHVKGRLQAIELKGSFEQWNEPPDRILTWTRLGPVKTRTGYDGHVGWVTDLDSKRVRLLQGAELEPLEAQAYFENEMWARPGQGGGKVVHGSPMFRDQDEYLSLAITPPVGPSRRLWFSSKTGLLVRTLTEVGPRGTDFWLSGYRRLGGRMRPTIQDALDPALHVLIENEREPDRFQVDSIQAGLPGDSSFFAPPASAESAVAWHGRKGVAHVPFRYGSRHVWIKVSINGAPPADFLLDTGASITAIDRAYADQIGLTRQGAFGVQGMGGMGGASFAHLSSVRVGGAGGRRAASAKGGGTALDEGVSVGGIEAAIIDFGQGHREVMWRKLSGLIGYDFLSHFVVELDYDHQQVTLREPKGYRYDGLGTALDMKVSGGLPLIEAQLGAGCRGDFLVDVGNSFGLIVHRSLSMDCGMLRSMSDRKEVKILTGGVGSSFANWLCRIDSLEVGPFAVASPIAGLSLSTQGMVGSKEVAGNFGNGVLERFKCTFDYARSKLYLEPSAKYAQPDRYSRAGALFLRLDYRVIVEQILHGSPAEEAGLKPEDEVVTIDGRPAMGFTPEEIDRMFVQGEPGSTHRLTIQRDGKKSTVTLKLRDVI
jgi:PDZ domain-containing protein/gag-polyprotein putative aspartyl protease